MTALGAALRLARAGSAPIPDEIGMLYGGPWWGALTDPEVGVNPPLLRAIMHMPAGTSAAIPVGRALSLVGAVAAIPLAGLVAARVTGRAWPGWLAAALIALSPQAVFTAATARAYGPGMGLGAWLLFDLIGLLDGDPAARRRVWLPALLLPWIHYLWLPVIGAAGLALTVDRGARAAAALLPAASVLVMAPVILAGDTSRRVASQGVWTSLVEVGGMGMTAPGTRAGPQVAAALALGIVAVAALRLPRLSAGERVLTAAAAAVVAAVITAGQVQLVRNPVATLLATAWAPLAAAMAARAGPVGAALVSAALLTTSLTGLARHEAPPWAERAAVLARHVDALPVGEDVLLSPTWAVGALWYHHTGDSLMNAPDLPGCPPGSACVEVAGRRLRTYTDGARGLVLDLEGALRPPCPPAPPVAGVPAWDCR